MIKTWQERLAAMDHSNGTSNKMRMDCMGEEIRELRKVVAARNKTWDERLVAAKARAAYWQSVANSYKKELEKHK